MKICATVSWDPKVAFKQSTLVDIALSFEGDAQEGQLADVRGRLTRPDTAMGYLWQLYYTATKDLIHEKGYIGKLVERAKGKRRYEMPVRFPERLEELLSLAEGIWRRHFIVSRNEWVNDDDYNVFMGSSGWAERYDYPRGDFVETIRQTVYDMEHGHPQTYLWSNVPQYHLLADRIESDPEFAAFVDRELKPLHPAWDAVAQTKDNTEIKVNLLTRISDAVERYMQQHHITRL